MSCIKQITKIDGHTYHLSCKKHGDIATINDDLCSDVNTAIDEEWCEHITTPQRVLVLVDLLVSARCIAQRKGENTDWERFDARLAREGIGSITAKTFRILPSDEAC